MEKAVLKLTREPEYFKNPNRELLIELYSFDSSQVKDLFKLGNDEYITLDNFKLEIQKSERDNIITKIFVSFNKVPADKLMKITRYFKTDENRLLELSKMEMADMIFSINQIVVEEVIQNYYDNVAKGNSLQLFSILDNEGEQALFNFKYYKSETVIKIENK